MIFVRFFEVAQRDGFVTKFILQLPHWGSVCNYIA